MYLTIFLSVNTSGKIRVVARIESNKEQESSDEEEEDDDLMYEFENRNSILGIYLTNYLSIIYLMINLIHILDIPRNYIPQLTQAYILGMYLCIYLSIFVSNISYI
jgi:hypothetical protein